MKKLLGLLLTTMLAGCGSTSPNLTFGTDLGTHEADEALLVIAVGPLLTGGHINFERVNDTQTGFDETEAFLGFGAYGSGSMLKRPEGETSSFWKVQTNQVNFLVSNVKPGLFTATDTSFNGFNGVSTTINTSCRRDGAATFVIQPGKINIIMLEDAFPGIKVSRLASTHTEQTVKDAFERTRANYPSVKGDPIFVAPTQESRWLKGDESFFSNTCESVADGSFTLSRRTINGEASVQDDADKAAIDAALSNLKSK